MRQKTATVAYYTEGLGFALHADYGDYIIVQKDHIEIHFFAFPGLNPLENYGQVYIRTKDIEGYYRQVQARGVAIHPNGPLQPRPWGQQEFSLLDPDYNLLTFGEAL